MASAPLLDREFLEKLERLTIRWRQSFAGLVGGHNISHFAGPGQEFLDHRNYRDGDDLRAVNWRAYLRLNRLFLKIFQVEPRVPIRLLIDASGSMQTHGGRKFEHARKIAAALCYVGLVRLDSMEVHPFAGRLGPGIISSGGRSRFPAVMDGIATIEPGGRTDYFGVVRDFIGAHPQPGLAIVISDFLDDGGCERALQYLADYGHELTLIQLWADEDRVPPWSGEMELRDAESGDRLKLEFDDAAKARYTRAFDEYGAALDTLAGRSGGRHIGVAASRALESILFTELIRVRGVA